MKNKFLVFTLFVLVVIPLGVAENEISTSGINQIIEETQIVDFDVVTIVPQEVNVGDVQLNILVKNTGTEKLENVMCILSGNGFSTYDMTPIEILDPGERGYIIVIGNFEEDGLITMTIKMLDKTFRHNINVKAPVQTQKDVLEQLKKEEQKKEQELMIVAVGLKQLRAAYSDLKNEYNQKKMDNYDVSSIEIDGELARLVQYIEFSILLKDPAQANDSLVLGFEELNVQKERLDNSKLIKKSLIQKIRENLLSISALAASIIVLVTFYELIKKKRAAVSKHITRIKKSINNRLVPK